MSRQFLPFFADDVSSFARALRRELSQSDQANAAPSHLTLLNMVARAGGYQNSGTSAPRRPRASGSIIRSRWPKPPR